MRTLQRHPDLFLSNDAIEQIVRAWRADPKKVAWAQDRHPEVPIGAALRAVAEAMWDSAVPIIRHYRSRPRAMRRIRRRWIDTLSQPTFARWRDDAECHRAARPFTWETEKDMAARESRRTADASQSVSGRI